MTRERACVRGRLTLLVDGLCSFVEHTVRRARFFRLKDAVAFILEVRTWEEKKSGRDYGSGNRFAAALLQYPPPVDL